MTLLPLFNAGILWVRVFSAILFIGGSSFIWLVVLPASHLIAQDGSERMRVVKKIARQFGTITGFEIMRLNRH